MATLERMSPRTAIVAAVCCAGLFAAPGAASAAADEPATPPGFTGEVDPWLDTRVAAPVMEDRPLQRSVRGEARAREAAESSGGEQPGDGMLVRQGIGDAAAAGSGGGGATASPLKSGWLRTTLSLAGVVALIVVLGYASRKLPGAQRGRRPGLIQVLSRTPLTARQSVYLLRVGPRLVLVGATADRLTRLDVVDNANLAAQIAGDAQRASADSADRAARDFNKKLASEAGRYAEDDGDDPSEAAVPSETRLLDVKQRLAGTLEKLRARRPA